MNEQIESVLQQLYHPELKEIDLSLGRMERALEVAGTPHLKLPPVIHLAGTNGKGSTLATLRAIYEAAGYKVHAYTSPHLVHVRERFYCAGEYLDDETLLARLEALLEFTKANPLTFFEATTLLAFQLFSEIPADVVLLETGLGGQFDATNVVPNPALTIITPISMDHQSYLGDTLAKIAYEKACIMKRGAPCISAPQENEAVGVLRAKAEELSVALGFCGEDFEYEKFGEVLFVDNISYPLPNLHGEHQAMNAAVAIHSVQQLQGALSVSHEQIAQGLTQIQWPARMQYLTEGKYAAWAEERGAQLWLDGGHNEAAAQEIAKWIRSREGRKCHVVCAMSNGHAPEEFFAPFLPHIKTLSVMEIKDEPMSHSSEFLYSAARNMLTKQGRGGILQPLLSGAVLERVLEQLAEHVDLEKSDILLVGSLYFAGKVLAESA